MGFIIDYHKRNWQARCVYEKFMEYRSSIDCALKNGKKILRISNFENGRERGYTLKMDDLEISWAENRNSDDIVVYPFKWADIDEVTDEWPVKPKYFKYQQFQEVMNFILEYLGIDIIKGTVK